MTCSTPRWIALWALACVGCVEQDPGLAITVEVAIADLPTDPVPTLAGPLPMTDARLRIDALVLEPCPEVVARGPLSWLLGTARAHGGANHAEGALIVDLKAELSAGHAIGGLIPVPPNHPICAIELRFDPSRSAELTVMVDGAPRRWAPPIPTARWIIPPLSLDRDRAAATVHIESAPARWLAPFDAGGSGDRQAPLSEQLAAGVTESLTVHVR